MASLKFRHYATESALKGTGTVQDALKSLDVGTIVFIDDTQKQYIITSKSNSRCIEIVLKCVNSIITCNIKLKNLIL